MDKDQPTANEADVIKTDEPISVDTDNSESNQDAQIIVKKTGGAFSLLVAILALGLAAYTFYIQWQQSSSASTDEFSGLVQEIEQLKTSFDSISSESMKNKNAYSSVNRLITEQGERLSKLENQEPQTITGAHEVQEFDNSVNERVLRQLTQQFNAQQKLIAQLQNELANRPNTPTAQEEILLDQEVIDKARAAQTLSHVQMMVDNQNISGAIDALENFLLLTDLNNNWKSKFNGLTTTLKSVEIVDIDRIKNQLEELESVVDNIQLAIQSEAEEGHWYERFVSVKKIDENAGVESSVELFEVKTAIKRKLYEAKLYLSIQDQSGWQKSLSEANEIASAQLSNEEKLRNQLEVLANELVINKIPESFDTEAIISELKGLR